MLAIVTNRRPPVVSLEVYSFVPLQAYVFTGRSVGADDFEILV
ncbi:MAG: hypothetical protein JWP02_2131, partial [Acidimicrobiales bacterium]|nr:hypothetical protein [Acidimicrobiales bacterium]